MRRRSHVVIRLLLGLTGLATVWCLGCSAFDPLLAALFPEAGATMVCASERPASTAALEQAQPPHAVVTAASSHEGGSATSCGCDSCHAPAPTALDAAVARVPFSPHPVDTPVIPASVARAPLVPPPQRVA